MGSFLERVIIILTFSEYLHGIKCQKPVNLVIVYSKVVGIENVSQPSFPNVLPKPKFDSNVFIVYPQSSTISSNDIADRSFYSEMSNKQKVMHGEQEIKKPFETTSEVNSNIYPKNPSQYFELETSTELKKYTSNEYQITTDPVPVTENLETTLPKKVITKTLFSSTIPKSMLDTTTQTSIEIMNSKMRTTLDPYKLRTFAPYYISATEDTTISSPLTKSNFSKNISQYEHQRYANSIRNTLAINKKKQIKSKDSKIETLVQAQSIEVTATDYIEEFTANYLTREDAEFFNNRNGVNENVKNKNNKFKILREIANSKATSTSNNNISNERSLNNKRASLLRKSPKSKNFINQLLIRSKSNQKNKTKNRTSYKSKLPNIESSTARAIKMNKSLNPLIIHMIPTKSYKLSSTTAGLDYEELSTEWKAMRTEKTFYRGKKKYKIRS